METNVCLIVPKYIVSLQRTTKMLQCIIIFYFTVLAECKIVLKDQSIAKCFHTFSLKQEDAILYIVME